MRMANTRRGGVRFSRLAAALVVFGLSATASAQVRAPATSAHDNAAAASPTRMRSRSHVHERVHK